MKNIALLIITVLTVFSCEKDDTFPQVETITSGEKWTLKIGSSPVEVYGQLQELGSEKNFDDVALVYRQPFSMPNQIQSDLHLYKAVTLETTSGVTERILIQFDGDKVSTIEKGGSHLEAISKWPENEQDGTAIQVDDTIDGIKQKLENIYQIPTYQNYQIVLSDKWLEKPYDSDMNNYDEWAFSFSNNISSGRAGYSSVRLFFKNRKLSKIRYEYNETDIVN